ncbi:MAG: hypothetical protein JWP97_4242 [Labilithrix sp.]|nr:hypothetical protein [Labilithrix sp.]
MYRTSLLSIACALAVPSVAHAQGGPAPDPVAPAAPAAPDVAAAPPPPTRAQQMRRITDQLAAQQKMLEEQAAIIKRLEEKDRKTAEGAVAPLGGSAPAAVGLGAPATSTSSSAEGRETVDDPREKILLYGYVQGQFQTDSSSQNVVAQDGHLLNQNRFLLPRARLIAEREWRIASVLLELDGNTLNRAAFGVQRAEATILYRGADNNPPEPPLVSATLGQFRVPFGDENLQSPGLRYFMERSLASRAFFPSEVDLGLRVAGGIGWFRYQLAATNGNPIGSTWALQDPDSAKDVGGRLGVAVKPTKHVDVSAGISSIVGRGFHEESPSTKSNVQWVDQNGDGIFQASEVGGVSAVAARPSSTFRRFGLALDGQVNIRSVLGETQLAGAFYLGNNMDRGVMYSDPVLLGRDTRQTGYMLSVLQEAGKWGVVGFRTDYYNPDSDSADVENARPVQPNDRSIRTYSPIVGVRFQRRARLLFQYDIVTDKFGRDLAGIPTDLSNDRATVRLQVNL